MIGLIFVLIAGMVIGSLITVVASNSSPRRRSPSLPAATAGEIRRSDRRNRADLRHVRPARQLVDPAAPRTYVFRADPPRLELVRVDARDCAMPRLCEPRSFLPTVQQFDEEHTQQ